MGLTGTKEGGRGCIETALQSLSPPFSKTFLVPIKPLRGDGKYEKQAQVSEADNPTSTQV